MATNVSCKSHQYYNLSQLTLTSLSSFLFGVPSLEARIKRSFSKLHFLLHLETRDDILYIILILMGVV